MVGGGVAYFKIVYFLKQIFDQKLLLPLCSILEYGVFIF